MQTKERFNLSITLMKTGECKGERYVYGVLSGRFTDLDGQVVAPEAIAEAIPLFMAPRGPKGQADVGGPLRWHHNDKFEGRTHELPVGVVTAMWQDDQGFTHFQAVLSQVTKEANDLWALLCEGKVKIGASVGGSILGMRNVWNPDTYTLVPTITKIRIDEVSLTDNPAFRTLEQLPNGSHGSYVVPLCGVPQLAKAAGGLCKAVVWQPEKHPRANDGRFGSKPGDHQHHEDGTTSARPSGPAPHDVHAAMRTLQEKAERLGLDTRFQAKAKQAYNERLGHQHTIPGVDPRHMTSNMPDHVLAIRHELRLLEQKIGHIGGGRPYPYHREPPWQPDTTSRMEAPVQDILHSINITEDRMAAHERNALAHGHGDAVDNYGRPARPTRELGNTRFPQGTSDEFGTRLMQEGVTGGYNVTSGGDYLLDNKMAVSYAFYEEGNHGNEGDPKGDNLKHLEAVKLFLQQAGIPYKVESLQGAVHNDGSWESESHMRLTPGPGGKGHVEHTNQQVIVALPRTQEELEDVAHTLKAVSPWSVPDIRVVGSTRPLEGFDGAYANIQKAMDGPERFIVLSKTGTNTNFREWQKAPIQVLGAFKEWLAE